MSSPASVQPPDPGQQLLQLALSYMLSISVNVVAKLKIADLLKDGPRPTRDLAAASGVNEDALYRVMRALASSGVFAETAPRTFALTPAAEPLCTGSPLYDLIVWISDPFHFRIYAETMYSVKTGQPCADRVLGKPIFEYFPADKEESEIFNAAMISMTAMVIPAVLEAYDFSGIGTLVDVAGGHGSVISGILQKHPQMRGILFDLEHVVAGAKPRLEALGLANRIQFASGDFFQSVPTGGDAFIMKHIIHDWDDARALTILKNCRKASPKAKVILLEAVLPPGNDPHFAKMLDLEMLTLPGGRERTEEEFGALFAQAGYRLARVVPTKSPLCVIEAAPA
ncbi:MAG: methyltransferase [Terriglobales bacterium]